jgi:hypothetical protein
VLRVKERGAHPTCNTGPIAVSSRKDHVHGVAGAENAHSPSSLSWLWEQASLEVGGQLNCLAWSASDNRSPGGRARRTPATELTRRKEYCPREGKQLQNHTRIKLRAFHRKLLQIIEGTMLHATANTSTVMFLRGASCALLVANYLGLYIIVNASEL